MQAIPIEDMGTDQCMDRCRRRSAGTELIGQRREVDVDTFLGIALGLTVERLVLPHLSQASVRTQIEACALPPIPRA